MKLEDIQKLLLSAHFSEARDFNGETYKAFKTDNVVELTMLCSEKLRLEYYDTEIEVNAFAEGVYNLMQFTQPYQRIIHERMYREYLRSIEELGYGSVEEAMDSEDLGRHVPAKSALDIADLVSFFSITGSTRNSDGQTIISVRGNAAWDCEHGMALFFENGERLIKVGSLIDSCD